MAKLLESKVIVITGAAGLIGRCFSRTAVEQGASVVLLDKDIEAACGLAIELRELTSFGPDIRCIECDITNPLSVRETVSEILKSTKIDVLVNNAYPKNKNYGRKFEDVTHNDFCENVNAHLGGYFLVTKAVVDEMIKRKTGNIINVASIYGFTAPKFEIYEGTDMTIPVEYATTKAGIINLTRYLASYLGEYNIRVNAISPGGVFNGQDESFVRNYERRVPLGNRMAKVEDLAGPFLFLASDMSVYVTGQNIVVDGGFTL